MGSTNRSKTGYVAEVTAGTTPATPAIQELRVTSNGLEYKPTRTTSSEIRSDRQVTDQILTKFDASGALGIEWSFNTFDQLLEAAFQGAWANNPAVTSGISALTTTALTVGSGAGTPFKAQMLCQTAGFATPANNALFVVASSGSTSIVFPSSSFIAEATPPAGASIRNVGVQGASGDIVATAGGLTSTSLDFTTLGLHVGQWVRVGGDSAASAFATAANNGWAHISAIAAGVLTFNVLPTGWTADAGASKTIQIFYGDFLANGTTQRSFTFERQQQDLASPSYEYFTGQQVDEISLSLKASAIVTGSISLIGLGASATTTRIAGATDVAPTTCPVMNAASNVGTLAEGGVLVAGPSYMMELGFDLKNNLAAQPAVGFLPAIGVRNGEIDVSGNISAYFGDLNLLNKVINDTDTALMFRIGRKDNNRESIVIGVPSAKLTGTSPVSAKNQDRMFTGTYSGKRSTVSGCTATAERFWYLPLVAA